MTAYSVEGRVIYINNIIKILEMSDEEFDEEYRDIIASDIGEDIDDPFANPSSQKEPDEETDDDFKEFEDLINQKMS